MLSSYMVACTEPRSKIPTLSESVAQHSRRPLASFLGFAPTYIEQARGISHSPSPRLLTTDDCPLVSAHNWVKSFRCNTYGSPASVANKRLTVFAKPFRCNTYKKHGGGGTVIPLWSYHITDTLTRLNPFICDSYENTGGVGVFFPFWNSSPWQPPSCAIKACTQPCAIIGVAACASDRKAS